MTSTNNTILSSTADWVNDATTYFVSVIILQMVVKFTLRLLGIITNLLTIFTFLLCDLRDGISACFLALTISDMFCLLASLLASLLGYLDIEVKVKPYVSLYYVSFLLPFYGIMFYNISTVITVFLTVQKCCCVTLPLTFRNHFSRRRCLVVVMCIYLSGFFLFVPFTVTVLPFQATFDYSTNSTRLMFVWTSKFLNNIFPVLKAVNYISIPFIAEIVVLFSTMLLTTKLRQAARFRSSSAAKKKCATNTSFSSSNFATSLVINQEESETSYGRIPKTNESFIKPSYLVSLSNKSKTSHKEMAMAKKDVRATLAVNVVAIIFVATNTPDVLSFFASLINPSFSSLGQHYNIYKLCIELQDLLHVLNLSANLFIYLKFNTRFAQTFKGLFLSSP